jgi:hypothetical protein
LAPRYPLEGAKLCRPSRRAANDGIRNPAQWVFADVIDVMPIAEATDPLLNVYRSDLI